MIFVSYSRLGILGGNVAHLQSFLRAHFAYSFFKVNFLMASCFNHEYVIATPKGHVKLIKRVKIAHSFLQSVSDQFHVIILSLPM